MKKVRLFIADAVAVFREGLTCLVEKETDMEIVGEAGTAEDCLRLLEKTVPDVLLLDAAISGGDGWNVLKQVRSGKKDLKVLIFMSSEDDTDRFCAQKLGADGFLSKKVSFSVLKNEIFLLASNPSCLEFKKGTDCGSNEENLTNREVEVLKLIAEGLFNKEIAFRLSISEKTVKNHITNIFKKIGVSDRTQAAVYAIKHHIVKL